MSRYFIGVDLASESMEVCILRPRGKAIEQTLSWSPARWKRLVEKYGAEKMNVAFEASPEAYRFKPILEKLGVEMYCFHPAHFQVNGSSKKKTDKIDARAIARALKANALPRRIQMVDAVELALRNGVSERENYLRRIQGVVNRAHGLARQYGIKLKAYTRFHAEAWWEEAIRQFPKAEQPAIRRLARGAYADLQSLDELEEEVKARMDEGGFGKSIRRLKTIPGFGDITSQAVALYLGPETSRYGSARKFGSYLGLTPSIEQTGKQGARLGHITKEGPPALRRLLVQAANAAVRSRAFQKTRLYYWFRRLAKRRGRKIAIVALARKLAITAYAMHRDETDWSYEHQRLLTA